MIIAKEAAMKAYSLSKSRAHIISQTQRNLGFTLIEIMVAMAIMALISIGAISILNKATESNDRIKINGDRLNSLQRAFLTISNDIQQLTNRVARDEFGDPLPSMKSDQQSSAPYVRFTRLGRRNPALLPRSNLEHLAYLLEDKVLYRQSYNYVDGMIEEHSLKRPLIDKVESFSLQFFDGEQWHDFWPINEGDEKFEPGLLPIAVKLNIELSDQGSLERLYAISDKRKARNDREG